MWVHRREPALAQSVKSAYGKQCAAVCSTVALTEKESWEYRQIRCMFLIWLVWLELKEGGQHMLLTTFRGTAFRAAPPNLRAIKYRTSRCSTSAPLYLSGGTAFMYRQSGWLPKSRVAST